VAAGHRCDMPDPHRPAAGIRDLGIELRKMRDDRIVEIEQTFSRGKAGRGRREGLAQRIQEVRPLGGIWPPPAFGDHLPMSHQHDAVHLDVRASLQRIEEGEDAGRIDVLLEG